MNGHQNPLGAEELSPIERRAQELYDACRHDRDDLLSLRKRARFSCEAGGAYRRWLRSAAQAREAGAEPAHRRE
jgi:hypothetical protein